MEPFADLKAFSDFIQSLPESQESVLVEFLNAVRQASSLAEVNVAAGIAHARLTRQGCLEETGGAA